MLTLALFPRARAPRESGVPTVPPAAIQRAQSGAVQTRDMLRMGRRWREVWPAMRVDDPDVQALLAFIERARSTGEVFDVLHTRLPGSGLSPLGAGGGVPVVSVGGQVGELLTTAGWTANVTRVVAAGDFVRVSGFGPIVRVTAHADSNASGQATLRINPAIPPGASPAAFATIQTTGTLIKAVVESAEMPKAPPGLWLSGLSVTFLEVPNA